MTDNLINDFINGKIQIEITPDDKDYLPNLKNALGNITWNSGNEIDDSFTLSMLSYEEPLCIYCSGNATGSRSIFYTSHPQKAYLHSIREFVSPEKNILIMSDELDNLFKGE